MVTLSPAYRTSQVRQRKANDISTAKNKKSDKPRRPALSNLKDSDKRGLDGAFIQLWPEMSTNMSEAQWHEVLTAMKNAGLKTIIIQYLRHNDTDLFPANPGQFDPTEEILSYADSHVGTHVFLGLGYDTAWYNQWKNDQFLRLLAEKNRLLATQLWTRYGARHKSFSGWYIPQEAWNENYSDEQIKNLQLYYTEVVRHCKSLSKGLLVAVAPFFNPNEEFIGTVETPAQNAERFAKAYAQLLDGSQIDIVMLQDGVGARKIEPSNFNERIVPYFDAFKRFCAPKVKELWADLEAYRTVGDERRPAEAARFIKQIEMLGPLATHAVTFEFFHYMNPKGNLKPLNYQQEQAQLYQAYLGWLPRSVSGLASLTHTDNRLSRLSIFDIFSGTKTTSLTAGTGCGVITTPSGTVIMAPPGCDDARLDAKDLESIPIRINDQEFQLQLPKDNQGGAASAFFLAPYGTASGTDADADGILDTTENELAERFAPIIIHDKDDANLPAEVDWFLKRTSMEYYNNNGFLHRDDHQPMGGPPLTQVALLGKVGAGSGGNPVVHSDGTRSRDRQHTFAILDVSNSDRQGSLSTSDWRTYFHCFRNYYGGVTLQYWRFYAYNTGNQGGVDIDNHGGDWEGVQVLLGKDLEPVLFRFLGHVGIETKTGSEVELEGNHLRVYSEPGGHASHAKCNPSETIAVHVLGATIEHAIWLKDLNDKSNTIRQETWRDGKVFWPSSDWRSHPGNTPTPSGGLINVGEKLRPLNNQMFILYSGLWGSLGDMFSGYWGPAFNETEMAPDGLITAWGYSMKASKSNFTTLFPETHPKDVCP
jgi:hypothetical protein